MRFDRFVTVALVLFGSVSAQADDALIQAYAPLRVVALLRENAQVLLWDEGGRAYRLVEVGDEVDGWHIDAVRGDQVTVSQAGGGAEVLAPSPIVGELRLAGGCAAAAAPVAAVPAATPAVVLPSVVTAEPVVVPPAAVKPEPLDERRTLSRRELDRELADFDRLLNGVTVHAAPGGGFVVTSLDPKSWLWKIGLRQGDVVRQVAGEAVSTVDDAARVYARLRGAAAFDVEVVRGDRRVRLHYQIG